MASMNGPPAVLSAMMSLPADSAVRMPMISYVRLICRFDIARSFGGTRATRLASVVVNSSSSSAGTE